MYRSCIWILTGVLLGGSMNAAAQELSGGTEITDEAGEAPERTDGTNDGEAPLEAAGGTNDREEVPEAAGEINAEEAPLKESKGTDEEKEPMEAAGETDGEEESLEVTGEDEEKDVLYSVSFPTDTHACLDPGNLSGKGQIFSEHYAVENYGNTEVKITIKNIDVYYASTEDVYEFSDEEIDDHSSRVKKLNIGMVWGKENEDSEKTIYLSEGVREEEVLTLEASDYDENGEFADLKEGSSGYFYFTGTLNANPNLEWEEGELIVRFDYEILSAESEEEKKEEGLETSEQSADIEKEESTEPREDAQNTDNIENTGSPETPEGDPKDPAANTGDVSKKENQEEGIEPPADEEVKKDSEKLDEITDSDQGKPDTEGEAQQPGETDTGEDAEKKNDALDTGDASQNSDQAATPPEGEVSDNPEGADKTEESEKREIKTEEGTEPSGTEGTAIDETYTEAAGGTGDPVTGTGP